MRLPPARSAGSNNACRGRGGHLTKMEMIVNRVSQDEAKPDAVQNRPVGVPLYTKVSVRSSPSKTAPKPNRPGKGRLTSHLDKLLVILPKHCLRIQIMITSMVKPRGIVVSLLVSYMLVSTEKPMSPRSNRCENICQSI